MEDSGETGLFPPFSILYPRTIVSLRPITPGVTSSLNLLRRGRDSLGVAEKLEVHVKSWTEFFATG